MIYVVTPVLSPVLGTIGDLFTTSIKDNGEDVIHHKVRNLDEHLYKKGDICIITGTGRFPNIAKQKKEGVIYALWQSEPLPTPQCEIEKSEQGTKKLSTIERFIKYYDYYFDYSLEHLSFLENRGWKVDGWIPIGYHKSLDYTDIVAEIKYDAVFIGRTEDTRRAEVLQEVAKRCKVYPNTKDVWGDNLFRVIRQSKVGLNIHNENMDTFEIWRIIRFLCNKTLIVSEPISDSIPLVAGKHFISASRDEFPDVVRECVENIDRYKGFVEDAYEYVKNSFSFNLTTKKMLRIIRRDQE